MLANCSMQQCRREGTMMTVGQRRQPWLGFVFLPRFCLANCASDVPQPQNNPKTNHCPTLWCPKCPVYWIEYVFRKIEYIFRRKKSTIFFLTKMENTIWKSKTRSFQQYMGCLNKFLSEHNEKWSERFIGQTPLFEVLTDTEYVCPPTGHLNHAHHGANSAALLPGCMWNRFLCVCHSGVGRRLIWNWLSGDQLISTQSIPPQLASEVLSL